MWKVAATPGLIAIGCMLPVSIWWFIQASMLLATHSPAVSDVSLQAIHAMLLVQFLSVSLFSPHWQGESNEQSPQITFARMGTSVMSFVLPSLPLLAMLSLASGVTTGKIARAESSILVTGLCIAVIARVVPRLSLGAEFSRQLQYFLGLVAAMLVWVFRHDWFHWIGL